MQNCFSSEIQKKKRCVLVHLHTYRQLTGSETHETKTWQCGL